MISVSFWPFIFHLRGSSSPQTPTPTKKFPIKWITLKLFAGTSISASSRSLVCPWLIFRPCIKEAVVHWKILLLVTLCPGVTVFFFFFFRPRDCESLGLNGPMAFDYHSPSLASVVRCHAVLSCGTVRTNCASLRKGAFYFKTCCILNASSLDVASIKRFRYE